MKRSVFDWNTGEPTVFAKDPAFYKSAINQLVATKNIAKARAKGKDKVTNFGDPLFDFNALSAFNTHIATKEETDRTNSIRNSK